MIDNTIPPVDAQLLKRAEGYKFAPDVDGDDSVFAPNGDRVGGVYPTWSGLGWRGQSISLGVTDAADSPLEAAVLLAEAHILYMEPKTVERTGRLLWAVVGGNMEVLAVTAYNGDAMRLAIKLNEDFPKGDHKVVQLTERTKFTFDTKITND